MNGPEPRARQARREMDNSTETERRLESVEPSAVHGALALSHYGYFGADTISPATSPGVAPSEGSESDGNEKRYKPRTFSYFEQLPYPVEEESERDAALKAILKKLYISIRAEDFTPGALHWSRELQGWLSLKFEMTRELRARLVQLYYNLALSPGLGSNAADRFTRMLLILTKKKHYLKQGDDLILDWRPMWKEIKGLVLPTESASHQGSRRRVQKHLVKLCSRASLYFDPNERPAMLQELLPYFSTSDITNAYIVAGALNMLVPTSPAPPFQPNSQPADFLPTYFHLWSLMTRSKSVDILFIDICSRLAQEHLDCRHVPFSQHGIFTREQADLIFTAILRLTEIPVGQANSPYSSIDYSAGMGVYFERDTKKHPVPYLIARWMVHSLSPVGLDSETSVIKCLEGLMESVDTFFHPSNQGGWTSFLAQMCFYLGEVFVSRWNREQTGELEIPAERRITVALKKRFVLALREVTFMGLFSKSSKVVNYYYSTLQALSFLEPQLILPGALQRFYPSLQGLVEVHRTTSSLCSLQMIANTMSKQKGFRCHITALLALALPGIDANDLGKTQHTLNFIQSVAYSIPFSSLIKEGDDESPQDTSLAVQWVQSEMERMEREGQDIQINYDEELTDEEEARILRSSTAGLSEFVIALLGKVFTLLENLPDSSQLRTGSPEDSVINTLPAALTPLFATLSPELFDLALDKLAMFVSSHVVHQARDVMAWICNALCKVQPEKSLKVFIPMLIVNIRNEIDYNGAASDRSSGTEILPRARALVWHVSILSMCTVHVGGEVLRYKDQLLGIAKYMQDRCRGLPTIHISNYVHHLLLNLTHTYPIDNALYEPDVIKRGLDVDDWGRATAPSDLTIRWHRPTHEEVRFALELFESQVASASERLENLMSDKPSISRKGKNKEWSDELSRSLTALRLTISGVATLFDPDRASGQVNGQNGRGGTDMVSDVGEDGEDDTIFRNDDDPLAEVADDEELERQFRYPSGYLLKPGDGICERIHDRREDIGRLLSRTHAFLNANQEDDVACFTALYNTYRTWITDVGIERSAHPLERLVRLYKADIAPFKVSGLRKTYPRPLLVRRADAYQLQRVKYNASMRKKSELDKLLLLDLAESCTCLYADVRRVAQGAQDSSLKALLGGRPLVIPVILSKYREALDAGDHDRIKGAMYTLLFTSLLKTIMRDWRFAPDLMRMYIETATVDKASIQHLGSTALYPLLEFGKPFERMVLVDPGIIATIKPEEDCSGAIKRRHDFILERRAKVEGRKTALGLELTRKAKESHWKIANRCVIFAGNMCVRFDNVAPPEFIDLVVHGANDPHPALRTNYGSLFTSLLNIIDVRAVYQHSYRKFLEEAEVDENKLEIPAPQNSPDQIETFLDSFEDYDNVNFYVDSSFPGWLVWGDKFTAMRADPKPFLAYDETETAVRKQLGKILTKEWFGTYFGYMKQEPRDNSSDRFRMQNVALLMNLFDLVNYGMTEAQLDDIFDLTLGMYGDGSDKHQHRATAEIVGALLTNSFNDPKEMRDRCWEFAAPLLLKIIADDIKPDNLQYWITCLHLIVDSKDPRRSKELILPLSDFRLDMNSNAAFKEASKVQLLEYLINDAGWHFRRERPILEDFLAHLDHPYKAVRESIGRTIATIYRTRYHESFPNVGALLAWNKADSSIGIRPYKPSKEFANTVRDVFSRIERWRHERTAGQQTPSSYTNGSKTVLTWLDSMLSSQECTQLVPFFPEPFIDSLLHMMDVKEDPELMRLAYHVYRHLPNIPFRAGEDDAFVSALIRVGKSAASWHQRLRSLVNMQVVYFRRLFLLQAAQREMLFDAVGDMLSDQQIEVRMTASNTLAGMIRCSPAAFRDPLIPQLKERFMTELRLNPNPKRKTPGTDTPVGVQQQIVRRHAAVLGLGALIEAFPYATPPPLWMPEVLAHLVTRAASDPGAVGKTAKQTLADFKKTRQDSWIVDQKSFTSEQLEDLEGVLWKSYFA